MAKKPVHAWETLPTRLPVAGTLVVWLLLKQYQPPHWVWLTAAVVMSLVWLFNLLLWHTEVPVNIFTKTIGGKVYPPPDEEGAKAKAAPVRPEVPKAAGIRPNPRPPEAKGSVSREYLPLTPEEEARAAQLKQEVLDAAKANPELADGG
jgi:hypothetical protein